MGSDKRITTKVGPGSYKSVVKSNKTGKVWESTITFTATGASIETNAGGVKATETFKKGADFKIKTDSPWIPGGVMVMKSGESITVDVPGMGKTENIGYEGCDSWIQVTKCMGKTITTKEIISGDFLIAEAT